MSSLDAKFRLLLSAGLHYISCGYDRDSGTAYILDNHLPFRNGRGKFNTAQKSHGAKHKSFGNCVFRLDGALPELSPVDADSRCEYSDRAYEFVLAILHPSCTSLTGNCITILLIHRQTASPGAHYANKLRHTNLHPAAPGGVRNMYVIPACNFCILHSALLFIFPPPLKSPGLFRQARASHAKALSSPFLRASYIPVCTGRLACHLI